MADGELTLNLDPSLVEKLKQKAAKVGSTPEAIAVFLLEQQLFDYDEYTWDEDPRLVSDDKLEFDEAHLVPFETAWREFETELEKRLASKK